MVYNIVYQILVGILTLVPGLYAYFTLPKLTVRQKLALAFSTLVLPLPISLLFSRELAIVIVVLEMALLFYLENRYIELTINVLDALSLELKKEYAFIPKYKPSRTVLVEYAAGLIQRENKGFTPNQLYLLLEKTYGEQVSKNKRFLQKEIKDFVNSLQKKGRLYKLKGG